jgi:hypothetical protein
VMLNNMGVTIRQNVRLELILDKQTALMGKGRQVFEVWLAENEDSGATGAALARYRNDLLPGVRDLRGQLMQEESYGFTAADTVGAAMLMEFWMSKRLGENRSYRRQLGTTYATYFTHALDPATPGSPGKALADATAQRDRMKAILDAADAKIGPTAWRAEVGRVTRTRRNGRTTTYTVSRIVQTATGNQTTGYAVRSHEEVISETRDHDGECIRCGDIRGGWDRALAADPPDNGDQTPAGRVAYWNAVRATYVEAAREAAALGQVAATLRLYLEDAEALRASG